MRTLAHILRPRKLSELIGQAELVEEIQKQYESGREPPAWLVVGPSGTGKTTLLRILGVALQCTHGKFGEPCDACWEKKSAFAYREINASSVSGVDKIREVAEASTYAPMDPSRRLVIALDEAQRVSKDGQNLLLKAIEDTPKTTVWLLGTTEPNKFLEAMIRRGQMVKLRKLKHHDITKLVTRGLKKIKSTKKAEPLVDELMEADVRSPGFILNAVEKYANGQKAKAAVLSTSLTANALVICRSLEKADWDAIKKETREADADDLKGIRAQVAGYLRKALESTIPGPRAMEFAKAIGRLAQVDSFTDATQGPATVASLYEICQMMGGGSITDDDEPGLKD